jgi:hypothetical protein
MDKLHDNKTPAMIESPTDHVWSWNNFFIRYGGCLTIGFGTKNSPSFLI